MSQTEKDLREALRHMRALLYGKPVTRDRYGYTTSDEQVKAERAAREFLDRMEREMGIKS